jgi:hypothetical protein
MSKSTISTFQLFEMFPTPESARLYLESRLWPDGPSWLVRFVLYKGIGNVVSSAARAEEYEAAIEASERRAAVFGTFLADGEEARVSCGDILCFAPAEQAQAVSAS